MSTIDEKTKVPLFAAITAFVFLMGGVAWLTKISISTDANASALEERKHDDGEQTKLLNEILTRVVRIEEQIKHKRRGE